MVNEFYQDACNKGFNSTKLNVVMIPLPDVFFLVTDLLLYFLGEELSQGWLYMEKEKIRKYNKGGSHKTKG